MPSLLQILLPVALFVAGVLFGRWTRVESLRLAQGRTVALPKIPEDDGDDETG